ncbi:MAG: TonB family protein [Terracidiphilus sp.]
MRKGTVRGLRLWVMGLVVAAVCVASAEQRAVKSRVSPVYPEVAKRMRISGVVKLEASVDPDGKVTDVKTVSGNHMLGLRRRCSAQMEVRLGVRGIDRRFGYQVRPAAVRCGARKVRRSSARQIPRSADPDWLLV